MDGIKLYIFVTSCDITSHHVKSYRYIITSRHISSLHITYHRIASHPISSLTWGNYPGVVASIVRGEFPVDPSPSLDTLVVPVDGLRVAV